MKITLYQAAEDMRELLEQIDAETGEMPEGFELAREIVQRKAVSTVAYMLDSAKSTDAVEAYAKELLQRVNTERKRIEHLKAYLLEHMRASGMLKIVDDRGIFTATRSPERDESVNVFDEKQVPQDYMREIPATQEPDKVLIKKAIKDGFEVPGAKLDKRDRLTIK